MARTASERMFASSRNLSISTFASRILGFVRDVITGAVIGGGAVMSAWVLASTLANILRRILGEGALGTALVPILSHAMQNEKNDTAQHKFTTVFVYLCLLLSVITICVSVPCYIASHYVTTERWHLALLMTPVIMPYAVFICAVGVMTSYMNSFKVYFWPSITAIIQNVILIGALFFILPDMEGRTKIAILAVATLISGVVEFAFMLFLLYRRRKMFIFKWSALSDTSTLREVWRLALPGMIGASAYQLGVLVDRTIAGFLGDYAASALYYSDRIVLLPVGIFAVAFGTVSLTEMSHLAAKNQYVDMMDMMMKSLRGLLFITIPAAAFMFAFGFDIIKTLFMRDEFTMKAALETFDAFKYYVFGIPLFAALKVVVTGFTARKDMITPLKVSITAISLNIILNLALMIPMRQGGIALATVAGSLVNNVLLLYILNKKLSKVPFGELGKFLAKCIFSSVVPFAVVVPLYRWIVPMAENIAVSDANRYIKMLFDMIQGLIPLGIAFIVYCILVLVLSAFSGMAESKNVIRKLIKK